MERGHVRTSRRINSPSLSLSLSHFLSLHLAPRVRFVNGKRAPRLSQRGSKKKKKKLRAPSPVRVDGHSTSSDSIHAAWGSELCASWEDESPPDPRRSLRYECIFVSITRFWSPRRLDLAESAMPSGKNNPPPSAFHRPMRNAHFVSRLKEKKEQRENARKGGVGRRGKREKQGINGVSSAPPLISVYLCRQTHSRIRAARTIMHFLTM